MKNGIYAAALSIGLFLAGGTVANAAVGYRSLEIGQADGSTVAVNMSADMRVTFDATTMFVTSEEVQLEFPVNEVRGWGFSTEWIKPEVVEPPEPPVEYEAEGDGTWQTPFNSMGLRAAETPDSVWVKGYIVGTYTSNSIENASFTAENAQAGNILLAPAIDANHHSQCIAVQLPMAPNSDVRDAINLKDHPEYLGLEVSIKGVPAEIGGVAGLRSPRHYNWGPQGYDTNPMAGVDGVVSDDNQFRLSAGSITFSNLPANSSVSVYNIDGRVIITSTVSGDAVIDLSSLANGVYILNVNGKTVKISVKK